MKIGSFAPNLVLSAALTLGGVVSVPLSAAQQQAPDNTGANKTDRRGDSPTADQAKNGMSDRELMKHIRQDVVKDKSLSTYGHNVKIIATGGKVTLRGPVHSEDEKKAIEEHATKYAGAGNVTNELSVKGS
ncbi:MAG: BON domain-containing protein [Acidobacteriota bacterium]|nr:BON domain-containing protein [Acidobacteriota bacterium]